MIKKILQLVVVLFIATQGIMAQTVSIADNVMYQPGDITVQMDMNTTQDVSAITLHIEFDSDLMVFVGIDDTQLSGNWVANQTGNFVNINYIAPTGIGTPISGKLLDMLFEYKGGFSSALIFDEANCEIADVNLGVIAFTYSDGMVQQDQTDALAVSMPTDMVETIGNTIDIPVSIVGGDTYAVEAITLKIAYNTNELAFTGIVDGNITGAVANANDGVVTINWTGTESLAASDILLDVQFVYNGGNADVEFVPGCEFATASSALPVIYTDGMVTATPGTASLTISTEVADPGSSVDVPIVASNFGTTDIGAVTLNISFDNSLLSYVTTTTQQPATGWTVTANNANGTVSMQWSGATTFVDGNVVTLSFVYDIDTIGGDALIEFVGGTVLTDLDLVTIPVSLIGGAVKESFTVSGQLTYMGDVTRPVGTDGTSTTTVYLKNTADSTIAFTASTDASGNYTFTGVSSGTYFLDATTDIDATLSYDVSDAFIIYGIGGTLTGLYAKAADVNLVDGVDVTDAFIVYGSWLSSNVKGPSWFAPDWYFENNVVIVTTDVTGEDFSSICSGDVNGDFVPVP